MKLLSSVPLTVEVMVAAAELEVEEAAPLETAL